MISKVLNETLQRVLAAALAMAGTAVCTTVQTAAASSPTTKPDLTMTASYACPFSWAPSGNWTSTSCTACSGRATFKLFATALVTGTTKGCDLETEEWPFTERTSPDKRDAFWMTTAATKNLSLFAPKGASRDRLVSY